MIIDESDYLSHYGILRKSGRYPWGSGEDGVPQSNKGFLDYVKGLEDEGMSQVEIAKAMNCTTSELRNARSIASNEHRAERIAMATRLRNKGMSVNAVATRMGESEATVRGWLAPGAAEKANALKSTANMLKETMKDNPIIDIGLGIENQIGVTNSRLKTAVAMLREEGYEYYRLKVPQVGSPGQYTTMKVLAQPGMSYSEVYKARETIAQPFAKSEDNGLTFSPSKMHPPLSVDPSRIAVRYGPDGGAKEDGVMYIRPGVDDLSMGSSRYAQVRVLVGKDRYLKGMAIYSDDIPAGKDILFNTNKNNTGNDLDALKPVDNTIPGNPFGSQIKRQIFSKVDGKDQVSSALNIVNEEGDWSNWSKTISTQVLSKQSPAVAKKQLELMDARLRDEYDNIMALTNPSVRKVLLEAYADKVDAAAVHLKAAALPGQSTHVILPIKSLKDDEVFAPNYRDGERVVLIRYPHGGTFEIPELTVNSKNREARKSIGTSAKDAIGINHKVAERLSGADFDGDTVLVIPNGRKSIRTDPALKDLEGFNPREQYAAYPGMPRVKPRTMQRQMGDVSNLITDMTLRGASFAEIARAVKHSMVVIDSEKHHLDYKRSAVDNGIKDLKKKYQGSASAGATTLISRATSPARIPERKPRPFAEGGPIDPVTGKKVFVETGRTYVDKSGKTVRNTTKIPKLAATDDAFSLSSGTTMEGIYATHSNKLKSMANDIRRDAMSTERVKFDPTAKEVYASEVASLNAKLARARSNAPLERRAQVIANAMVQARRDEKPTMDDDMLKKVKSQALEDARARVGAKKDKIEFTDSEWRAVQAGALRPTKLDEILRNADLEQVRTLAQPRTKVLMNRARINRANTLLDAGYTRAEVARELGVSLSTLDLSLNGEG